VAAGALIEAARAGARHQGQLLLGAVCAHRPPTRTEQGRRRGRELDAVHDLAPCSATASYSKIPARTTSSVGHDPAVEAKRLARRIEALGFDVNLTKKAA